MRNLKKYGLQWLLAAVALLLLVPGMFHARGSDVWYTDRVAVIAYHHIDDHTQGDVTITTARFRGQLTDLLQRGYHFISLQQFRDFMAGGQVPTNAVLVTFDDGYRSFYTNAYPILKELNIPAVNFVITKDLEHPDQSLIPSLSRDQIRFMTREMKDIDAQCHSDSLHDRAPDGGPLLTSRLPKDGGSENLPQFEQRITDDTKACVNKLKELYDRPVDAYAYPFGYYDEQSITLLRKSGIRYGFTTASGLTGRDADPMQIPRINAGSPFVKENSLNNLIIKSISRKSS